MKFLPLLALCFLPLTLPAQQPTPAPKPDAPKFKRVMPNTPPELTMEEREVAAYPEHHVTLTIYVPKAAGTYPAILDLHGGGWSQRQVEQDKPMLERLAVRGFVTAVVSYRLAQEAKYPAAIFDCKAALRYLRAHAAELKLDPERIGVMGGSAGGHLSGLLAMTASLPDFEGTGGNPHESTAVKACVVMAGPMDLAKANAEKTSTGALNFFGVTAQERPELYQQASPIFHVRAGVPPVLFIEGEKDTLKIGRAEMQAKLRALGIETDLHTIPGAPHPFWMSQPWLDETVEVAGPFFKKHLGEPKR